MITSQRMKTAAVAAAIAAVTVMGAARAEAVPTGTCDIGHGALYICDYGVTQRHFPGGIEQFVIGSDYAVWTRWYYDDSPTLQWTNWVSLGGTARSEVFLEGEREDGSFITRMTIVGADGNAWQRIRPGIGAAWTAWGMAPKTT